MVFQGTVWLHSDEKMGPEGPAGVEEVGTQGQAAITCATAAVSFLA
jgi:hypothetical protein